jgi:hypothetical protein
VAIIEVSAEVMAREENGDFVETEADAEMGRNVSTPCDCAEEKCGSRSSITIVLPSEECIRVALECRPD